MSCRAIWLATVFASATCALALVSSSAIAATDSGASFFEEKIRPVLAQSCYQCHSARATKIKGGLVLDTAERALNGGANGAAIVPGSPETSPLIKAIRRADPDTAMPPDDKDKLSAESIAAIEKWIKAGAPFPDAPAGKPIELKPWWEALADAQLRPATEAIAAVVDACINEKLKDANVTPRSAASEANFIRRVTLDLVGRIPTAAEVHQYETSSGTDKKGNLIDRLMASPAYPRHQATEWDWMLMDGKAGPFREYLVRALKENRGWDEIFREIVRADAQNAATKGCEQFLKARVQDQDRMTTDVSVRFFGVNISCAQCHNHPHVPSWTQDHYYGMKSFFSRTFDAGEFVGERNYGFVSFKPLKEEKTKRAPLLFLDGRVLEEPEVAEPDDAAKKRERDALEAMKKSKQPPPAPKFSRREKLAEAGLQPGRDGFFARAIVNQTWARLFGQGLVMPVDQMHGQNRPSHPELLAWLARDLVARKYDVKALVRGLVLSDAYVRSSEWPGAERPSPRLFAAATPRALTPQQFGTSLILAGTDPQVLEKSTNLEAAVEKMEREGQGWAALFERPSFDFQVGVDEALAFSNSEKTGKQLLSDEDGKLVRLLVSIQDPAQMARTAYASILSREPEAGELEIVKAFLAKRSDRPSDGVKDVVWALMASSEFRFNH